MDRRAARDRGVADPDPGCRIPEQRHDVCFDDADVVVERTRIDFRIEAPGGRAPGSVRIDPFRAGRWRVAERDGVIVPRKSAAMPVLQPSCGLARPDHRGFDPGSSAIEFAGGSHGDAFRDAMRLSFTVVDDPGVDCEAAKAQHDEKQDGGHDGEGARLPAPALQSVPESRAWRNGGMGGAPWLLLFLVTWRGSGDIPIAGFPDVRKLTRCKGAVA